MKKILSLLFIFHICLFLYAGDACYTTYMEALSAYNEKKYAEAQNKFVSVAKNCGAYSDVWKKLVLCNQKILELQQEQKSQNTKLKKEKEKISEENKQRETEYKNQLAESKGVIVGQQKTIDRLQGNLKEKSDSIIIFKDKLIKMQFFADSLTQKLDTVQLQLSYIEDELKKLKSDSIPQKKIKNLKKKEFKSNDTDSVINELHTDFVEPTINLEKNDTIK